MKILHRHAELRLQRCLYQEVFEKEGQPQLLQATCCSQDAVWFEGSRKVTFTLHKQGADGCCRLVAKES